MFVSLFNVLDIMSSSILFGGGYFILEVSRWVTFNIFLLDPRGKKTNHISFYYFIYFLFFLGLKWSFFPKQIKRENETEPRQMPAKWC